MQTQKIRGLFQNVNDDRGIPAHLPQYALSERIDKILVGDYDFYALSEISIKNLALVKEKLTQLGYQSQHMGYAPNQTPDMTFYHVLAWKNLKCISTINHWFTDTPTIALTSETRPNDSILLKYNEQYEKGTLIGVFKAEGRLSPIAISVNHFGLKRFGTDLQYTNQCARMLANIMSDYEKDYPGVTIVAGADFNAFDDSDHVDEFLFSTVSNWIDITPEEKSFCGYPWDLGLMRPENKEKILAAREEMKGLVGQAFIDRAVVCLRDIYGGPICSKIDRVLTNEMNKVNVNITMDMGSITLDDYCETPFAASDHAGYIVEID